MKRLCEYGLLIAWIFSLIGFVVSLYFGEILQIEPCRLCWYQRIFLIPLVLILGIAAYKDDLKIIPYAFPLAIGGAFFAIYQTLGHWFPVLLNSSVCGRGQECGVPIFILFGFISFPLFSAIGFILIIVLLFLCRKK